MYPSADLVSVPVAVPPDFIGVSSLISPGTYGVTNYITRSWDYSPTGGSGSCTARIINPSAGAFSWASFDLLFSSNQSRKIVFCLGAPADYLVSRAAIGGSYWSGSKGNMCPDDLATWGTVVTSMVQRAKNTHGRAGSNGLVWQLWNEIDQTPSYGDAIQLLGPYTKITCQAITAVDPDAVILTPSIGVSLNHKYWTQWANSLDGGIKRAVEYCNAMSFHAYQNYNVIIPELDGQYVTGDTVSNFKLMKEAMHASGVSNLPIYITEAGFTIQDPKQVSDHARNMVVLAALGARHYIVYDFDDPVYFGIVGKSAEFSAIADLICGATITSLTYTPSVVTAVIDGETRTFGT